MCGVFPQRPQKDKVMPGREGGRPGFCFSAGADDRVQALLEAWQTDQTHPRPKAVDAERQRGRRELISQSFSALETALWGAPSPYDTWPLSELYGCLKTKHKEQKERVPGMSGGRTFQPFFAGEGNTRPQKAEMRNKGSSDSMHV